MATLFLDKMFSPIGVLLLVTDGERLCALDYAGYEQRMMALLKARYKNIRLQEKRAPRHCRDCLSAYWNGDYSALNSIIVDPGGTTFQQQVWSTLRTIPVRTVMTYSDLAQNLAKPKAARGVGAANALNPIAIVIPCHRLVGTSGALTGYAGGLDRKRWLLQHEGVNIALLGKGRAGREGSRLSSDCTSTEREILAPLQNHLYTRERSL